MTHRAEIFGYGFQFYWSCSCGRAGQPTTNGRATGGRDRHLRAALKREECDSQHATGPNDPIHETDEG